METHLTIKHLAPYLPYGFLYGIYENQKVIIRGMNYNSDYLNIDFEINNHNKVSSTCFFNEVKPILRPLSDLIKEIEFNGDKFIPHIKLGGRPNLKDYDIEYLSKNIDNMSYGLVSKLIKWHFDVFGLIEKGLAIDINTLTQSSE